MQKHVTETIQIVPTHRYEWKFFDKQKDLFPQYSKQIQMDANSFQNELDKYKQGMHMLQPFDVKAVETGSVPGHMTIESPFVVDADGNKKLSLTFNCEQFKPEDIEVKTVDNSIKIHAKHTEESGGGKVTREFTRTVNLPEGVDASKVVSHLTGDGVLHIEAPAPESVQCRKEIIIPMAKLKEQKIEEQTVPTQRYEWKFFDKQKDLFPQYSQQIQMDANSFQNELDKYKQGMHQLQPFDVKAGETGSVPGHMTLESPFVVDADGNKKLSLTFNCEQFKPEDIEVKTVENSIKIHAKRTEESGGSKVTREFTRTVNLPQGVDASKVVSHITGDGVLHIEAPAPESVQCRKEIIIPMAKLSEQVVPTQRYEWKFFEKQNELFPKYSQQIELDANSFQNELDKYKQGMIQLQPFDVKAGETRSVSGHMTLESPFVVDADGNKKLSLTFNCEQFKPEDIEVKTVENSIKIHAKRTEESGGSTVTREFTRTVNLPQGVDASKVVSHITGDGVLHIEAPAPENVYCRREIIIPITKLKEH